MTAQKNPHSESPAPLTTIVTADDHTLVRHGIKTVVEDSNKYTVIGESEDAEETINLVEDLQPDILVLDIGLPKKSGIEVIYALREKGIESKIVVLTMHENELMAKQALIAGAQAYIFKDFSPEELLTTLIKVLQGEVVLPPHFEHLRDEVNATRKERGKSKRAKSFEQDPLYKLSKREREVFFLLANGMPNRSIAKKLFISPRTVETHRARVIKKLGFKSTADLIRYAIKSNLLTP